MPEGKPALEVLFNTLLRVEAYGIEGAIITDREGMFRVPQIVVRLYPAIAGLAGPRQAALSYITRPSRAAGRSSEPIWWRPRSKSSGVTTMRSSGTIRSARAISISVAF